MGKETKGKCRAFILGVSKHSDKGSVTVQNGKGKRLRKEVSEVGKGLLVQGSAGPGTEIDLILNMREGRQGNKTILFVKRSVCCWAESHCKGGQLGGICGSLGIGGLGGC